MNKRKAILALLLLVPAPSLGTLCGMVWFPDTALGAGLFAASKVWLFGLPVLWHLLVDRGRISLSPPRHGGWLAALLSGAAISGVILLAYVSLADRFIDRALLIRKMQDVGLASPMIYAGGALYWILVNSVLEEYAWRWFCLAQCRTLMPQAVAVGVAALCFTLHHVIALRVYMSAVAVTLCSLGVFIGGAVWGAMVVRYRSIWPAYVSHAIVDLTIFAIGAYLIFA